MSLWCWLHGRRLGAYHDGELSGRRRRRLERHLGGCRRCPRELAAIRHLHATVAAVPPVPPLPDGAWDAFWPQVRARLAEPPGRRWVFRPPVPAALRPALAAAALALLAVVAPWEEVRQVPSRAPGTGGGTGAVAASPHVVIQSIETEDPDWPVLVYTRPDADMTVVWVFGLPRTSS